jgi:hypothetical protein
LFRNSKGRQRLNLKGLYSRRRRRRRRRRRGGVVVVGGGGGGGRRRNYRKVHSFICGLITAFMYSEMLASGLLPSNKTATCYHMGLIRGPICA